MHKRLILFFVVWFYLNINTHAQLIIDANNPNIKYVGRIDNTDPKAPFFNYSGVNITAQLSGTSIKVKLKNCSSGSNGYFYAFIDELMPVVIMVPGKTDVTEYTLALGLKDTIHLVKLVKITEVYKGEIEFHGFVLNSNENIYPLPKTKVLTFENIGNSITCGTSIGSETSEGQNYYQAYGCVAARAFSADYYGVCRSGIGVYRNSGNTPPTGSDNDMLDQYDYATHFKPPVYDFAGNAAPDIITVNLGTNDFSKSDAIPDLFSKNYDSLLIKVRGYYPLAKIIILGGPMVNNSKYIGYLKKIYNKRQDAGDKNIFFFEMSNKGPGHPNQPEHNENALELIRFIKEITGWIPKPVYAKLEVMGGGKQVKAIFTEEIVETSAAIFKLWTQGVQLGIGSVKADTSDGHVVYLNLDDSIKGGNNILLSLLNNRLIGKSGESAERFFNAKVQNKLPVKRSPYTGSVGLLPGKIEAEDFDSGNEGDSYHDGSDGNEGGAYRESSVDLQKCDEGGYNIGYTENGEWLEYTINIAKSGEYLMEARLASASSTGKFHIEFNRKDITGQIIVNSTGGWKNWAAISKKISLAAGVQIMRIYIESGGFNINWINFVEASGAGSSNNN